MPESGSFYKAEGYSVIAYTDHSIFIPHHELTDDTFLALSRFEAEFNEFNVYPAKSQAVKSWHLCFIANKSDIKAQPCWNAKYAYIGNAGKNHNKVNTDERNLPFERHYSPEGINKMIEEGRKFTIRNNHRCNRKSRKYKCIFYRRFKIKTGWLKREN